MSDITISPIPYNGGSMTLSTANRAYCDLGGGVLLNVAYQLNPNYLYAWINTVSNIKTGTSTSVNSPMRVLLSVSTTPAAPAASVRVFRLWKLNSNTALFLWDRSLYVLQVTPTNDVIIKNASIANFNYYAWTTYAGGTYNYIAGGTAVGAALTGWYIRDNVVYFFQRSSASTNYTISLVKVTYNSDADTLSQTTLWTTTQTTVSNQTYFLHPELKAIPNSTKRLFTIRAGIVRSTGINMLATTDAAPTYCNLVDTVTDVVSNGPSMTLPSSTIVSIAPLSETLMLGVTISGNQYYTWQQGAWGQIMATTSSGGMSNGFPYLVEALDSNYFIQFNFGNSSATDITGVQSTNIPWYARVTRFVDPTFGQANTPNQYTINVSTNWIIGDQPVIQRQGSDSFYIYGFTSSYAPSIGVIYQPGG